MSDDDKIDERLPLGLGVSIGVTANRSKLIESLLGILTDLEELHSMAPDSHMKDLIKEVHGKIAGMIEVK